MGNILVAYTITVKGADGKEWSFDKERILHDRDAANPETLQVLLAREFRESEQASFLAALQSQLGIDITSATFKVIKVTELKSAGDDDQM